MSRVPPIKKEVRQALRAGMSEDIHTLGKRISQRLGRVETASSGKSAEAVVRGILDLTKAEQDLALLRQRQTLMLYAVGATPRQIAEEMTRQGYPVDHQTVYRWVKHAVEEGGMTMAEIRETPKH